MPSADFAIGAVAGALFILLAWLAAAERGRRVALAARLAAIEQERTDTAGRVAALEQELANLDRVRKNKLYRESLEDVGFAASQAALHVHALRAHLAEELALVETILSRKVSP